MPLALITGGNGALAPALIREAQKAGFGIRVLTRSEPSSRMQGVDYRRGDICDPGVMRDAVAGVDVVFHSAALLHITTPDPSLSAEYLRVNVGGTRCVVDACVAADVRRIVFFSTIAVYGSMSGRVVDESTPPNPETDYGRTKLDAESVVLAACGSDSLSAVVLRFAAVYGPNMKGNYRRLFESIRGGRFVPIGPGRNLRTLVHEDDAARAAVCAALHPDAAGGTFNITDGALHPLSEIIGAISSAVGASSRPSLPVGAVRALLVVADMLARILRRPLAIGTFTLDKYLEEVTVSGEKARVVLGFHPRFDLRSGWAATSESIARTG